MHATSAIVTAMCDGQPDTLAEWFPNGRQTVPHFATALQAGRAGGAGAEHQLDKLILDRDQPGIARASALSLLPRFASSASVPAIAAAIADPDPLVRAAVPRIPSHTASPETGRWTSYPLSSPRRGG
jgi:hypothetical protein